MRSILRHHGSSKVPLAILIIGIGIFFEYIDEVMLSRSVPLGQEVLPHWVVQWDDSLLLQINPGLVNPVLSVLFGLVTHVGSTLAIVVLCAIFYLLGYKREAVLIFATIVIGSLATLPLKALVARPRPYSALSTVVSLEQEAGSSFPSGHSERIFALAAVLSKKRSGKEVSLYLLAFVVAFSRVYLAVHYPLDVLVGSLTGYFVGKATLRWEKKVIEVSSRLVRS